MKMHSPLDLVLNSLIRAVIEPLASDPATPTQGRIYYNTTNDVLRIADGSAWSDLAGSMSGADILAALIAVDGAGSGLDADTVDGLEAAAFALASHNHTAAQITDFAAAVDARITAMITNDAINTNLDTIAEFTQVIQNNADAVAAIMSVKRHQENIGDGSATTITVTHNLNSLDAQVQVVEVATGETVLVDVTRTGANTVDVGPFGTAPTTDQFRVLVLA